MPRISWFQVLKCEDYIIEHLKVWTVTQDIWRHHILLVHDLYFLHSQCCYSCSSNFCCWREISSSIQILPRKQHRSKKLKLLIISRLRAHKQQHILQWITCSFSERYLQTSGQLHTRLDRSTKPSVKPAAHRLPRPWEWIRAGERTEAPEAGDGGLEPRLLDQAELQLQQG